MTRVDWTALALKFYSVLVALNLVLDVSSLLVFYAGNLGNTTNSGGLGDTALSWSFVTSSVLAFFIPLLVAVFLWRKADSIASWIWRNYEKQTESDGKGEQLSPASQLNIKAGVLTAMGLYVFLTGLPALIYRLTDILPVIELMTSTRMVVGIEENAFKLLIPLLARVIQVLLSAILIVAPKRVLFFLDRAQDTWDLITED